MGNLSCTFLRNIIKETILGDTLFEKVTVIYTAVEVIIYSAGNRLGWLNMKM